MKFYFKVFLSSFIVITLSFSLGGYALISSVFNSSLNREVNIAIKENHQLYSSLFSELNYQKGEISNSFIQGIFTKITSDNENLVKVSSNNGLIYSNTLLKFNNDISDYTGLSPGKRGHQIITLDGEYYVQVVSKLLEKNRIFYIENIQNITSLYNERSYYFYLYRIILLGVIFFSSIMMIIISKLLTKPLKDLSLATEKIAKGDFSNRVNIKSNDEVGALSRDFNKMADVIEEKIHDLKCVASQREAFVASFAHELKTPLTSIIGYADSLRSLNMTEEKRFQCANYIFKEGKRLESLAFQLMDLIILNKKEFNMVEVNTIVFIEDIKSSLKPVVEKYTGDLNINISEAIIKIEPNLMKTLFYNLIDNAFKASPINGKVNIIGNLNENTYTFKVEDHGQGIDENNLLKITEPFYMIDKSRVRKGGAGLGLSICSEIALLHNTTLNFKSKLNLGTTVEFTLGGRKHE